MGQNFLCTESETNCFTLLYDIENYLRIVVRWELKGQKGKQWLGSIPDTVLETARARQQQEREIAYLDPREGGPLSYLHLSELKDIIVGPLWSTAFKRQWPPQDVVEAEFKKLIAIRNKSAHCRPVTRRDVLVVSRFAEDLSHWSRHYRQQREYATAVASPHDETESFSARGFSQLVDWASNHWETPSLRICALKWYGNHVGVSGYFAAGQISPRAFRNFVSAKEKGFTFFQLGDAARSFEIFFSAIMDDAEITDAMTLLHDLATQCIDDDTELDLANEYMLASHEAIISDQVRMPLEFVPYRATVEL